VDVRAIRLEPVRVSLAQLALPERPALAIGVPGEHGSSGAAAADAALCRIPAGDYLDLSSHQPFLARQRIVETGQSIGTREGALNTRRRDEAFV
jgi:hypothetical protein